MRVFILATGCFPTTAPYTILIDMRDVSRYDFMSDMAFGGGSEQMRDGDKDSIWNTMEQGLA